VSHPAGLPDLFVDRSLGRKRVPAILRAAGLRLTTLAEHYGIPADETVADVQWLKDATALGWVCLMKDAAIVRNDAEKGVVVAVGARCFCLSRQSLPAAVMAGWYLAALHEIIEAVATTSPPFLYAVDRGALRQLL
jgi:hypothetical protein